MLHTISKEGKKLLKNGKQFNELAVSSPCWQGVRIKFVQEEPGTRQLPYNALEGKENDHIRVSFSAC